MMTTTQRTQTAERTGKLSGKRAPGAAWYFYNDGKEIEEFGGLSDLEAKLPVTAKTTFNLFSVTKVFTATRSSSFVKKDC